MAALNQATGQNASNQAALMASQRGASANTGLIARQAAQQGANLQQQAVGQGATLQAQQSLGALGQLQGQQANMANLANSQVNQQQAATQNLGQQALGNQANIYGLQSNMNNTNASLANTLAQGQLQLMGNVAGGIGGAANLLKAGPAAAAPAMLGAGAGDAIAGGAAASLPLMVAAQGGKVPEITKGPRSKIGQMHHGMYAEGGKVPALVSPGEIYLKPKDVNKVADGKKSPMDGEKIKGKAKVKGAKDSYANDTVHKKLDEGGIVLPRSVTQSKDAPQKAAEFVAAILNRKQLPRRGK